MSSNSYDEFKLYVNRIKFNIEILIKKETKEINKLCELNIIKTKRDIEIYIKTLNNEQLIEFVEQLGYDIIYYDVHTSQNFIRVVFMFLTFTKRSWIAPSYFLNIFLIF